MKIERIKSIILFSLVIMSFVLTTRIWFYISIEGFFFMPAKDNLALQNITNYDKEGLLKPNKMIIHTDENHTLLLNNQEDKEYYSFALNASKDVLYDLMTNKNNYTLQTQGIDQLPEARYERAVELIFKPSIKLDHIKSLLNIENNPWSDITTIDSIIISPLENRLYLVDDSKRSIHQFTAMQMTSVLKGLITEIEKKNNFAFMLNQSNDKETPELYGDYAVTPVAVATMPVIRIEKEEQAVTTINANIAKFFHEEDNNISSIKEDNGTVSFTDREAETVNIDRHGVLEYYRYNVATQDVKVADLAKALEIATVFVNQHYGFNYDFYLSGIDDRMQGGRMIYTISYNYKYDGVPIVTKADVSKNAIEVEIVGTEVKRYTRNVRVLGDVERTVPVKGFIEILDMLWGSFNEYLYSTKSESIIKLDDMFLAYYEWNDVLIPVWIVDVQVQSSLQDGDITGKRYIIGAEVGSPEEGSILDEQLVEE